MQVAKRVQALEEPDSLTSQLFQEWLNDVSTASVTLKRGNLLRLPNVQR